MKKNFSIKGPMFLFLAAVIWGSSFVAQKISATYPFSMNALRFVVATIVLFPVLLISYKKNISKNTYNLLDNCNTANDNTKLKYKIGLKGGFICGISLAVATTLQQLGMTFGTSAGKSGFLTALYIIIIPLLSLFKGKKISLNIWISVIIAFIGAFLLSFNGSSTICIGDLFTIGAAFGFAINVLCVGKYAFNSDALSLSFFQMASSALICLISLAIVNLTGYEVTNVSCLKIILWPVLYVGIFSCCVAYTFQVFGQRYTRPAAAAVIMSLESVFSVIFGLIFLHESISLMSFIGILLIFSAVCLTIFNPFNQNRKNNIT